MILADPQDSLIKRQNEPAIWVIDADLRRRHVQDWLTMRTMGWEHKHITTVTEEDLKFVPDGGPLPRRHPCVLL